jgi:hypothetical protein
MSEKTLVSIICGRSRAKHGEGEGGANTAKGRGYKAKGRTKPNMERGGAYHGEGEEPNMAKGICYFNDR